ncbi:AMED_5909 family protein [Lentzea sp. DG1S-22]|uniref:AMED_5909 family protein n=1 Tax=Lentzea sp. DG1S-22 TaxID=3108822 RepID=UPI002E77C2FD|nr:AMED_5909 family protein [Lentzea sp. DG1S-22]WVH79227.1 AMED_5909 family protein [Lentzea sp. DG1S-22]
MPATEPMHWGLAEQVRTLSEAHDVLSKLLPNPKAAPAVLRDYYLRSAAIYARVAETDRSHHHEAIYWANREREKGEAIKDTKTTKN